MPGAGTRRGPILLCYDGSDHARRAIEDSAEILGGGEALVLTAFESIGSVLLRHTPFEETELGREFKEISQDVVNELDSGAAERAEAKRSRSLAHAEMPPSFRDCLTDRSRARSSLSTSTIGLGSPAASRRRRSRS
jgi:hypothetical protein